MLPRATRFALPSLKAKKNEIRFSAEAPAAGSAGNFR
jgi:hypothetical protein